MDYLAQLATEWYEYQGYFVHRDLWVGLEVDGSYECELDVVAFHPVRRRLLQIETSLDVLSWADKEEHFRVKFSAGRKYLHRVFGAEPRTHLEQLALVVGDRDTPRSIAGGRIVRLEELLAEILGNLRVFEMAEAPVPEQWPLLRTLQFLTAHRERLAPVLNGASASASAAIATATEGQLPCPPVALSNLGRVP